MNKHWHLVHVMRLNLQTHAAVSVTAGANDGSDDLRLALAPNGLPCLPASGIAGVLRARVRETRPDLEQGLFGWAKGQQGAESRLQVDPGLMHDAMDRPVRGWPDPTTDDMLVTPWLLQPPPIRRRNAGGHRGAALQGAHFDRPFVPAGTRFTVDMRLWGDDEKRLLAEASLLLSLCHGTGLRIGGATRSGMGRVHVVEGTGARHQRFDLRRPADLASYCQWMATDQLAQLRRQPALTVAPTATDKGVCTLAGTTDGALRVGGGSHSLSSGVDKVPDDLPYVEERIVWNWQGDRDRGSRTWAVVVPFSAVKGALSHRVAFHDHRLAGRWSSDSQAQRADQRALSPAVRAWFGEASGPAGGHAGAVFGDDCVIPVDKVSPYLGRAHRHQSDRFLASPMPQLLFNAESLYDVPLSWRFEVDFAHARAYGADERALRALDLALDDLAKGRLAIGADDAIGLGVLRPDARIHKTDAWRLPPAAAPAAPEPEAAA